MPHMREAKTSEFVRILLVGDNGTGKTAQLWTLHGRKFLYCLDPNTMASLKGIADQLKIPPPDIEYEEFYPDLLEVDAALKRFAAVDRGDKSAKDDKLFKDREPTVWNDWVQDINERVEAGFFKNFDWLLIDGLTHLNQALMARNLHIQDRYGATEEIADYKIVGAKLSEIFSAIASLKMHILMTGHINVFQDEKTKRMETLINTYGRSRRELPLVFTEIWQTVREFDNKTGDARYMIRTKPDPRGLQAIRSSIQGLEELEDVTIDDFRNAEQYGIGAILKEHSIKQEK